MVRRLMQALMALAGMLLVFAAAAQGAPTAPTALGTLTAVEREWIVAHPVVRVGLSREFPPYYFFGPSQQPHGFAIETMGLWAAHTGLRFEFHRYSTFAESIAALKSGEVDMTPFSTPVEAQRSFANFTRPAFVTNLVLAARRDVPDVSATSNFGGRSIAVEQGPGIEALVRERYPAARLLPYPDAETALRAVSAGEADLFIGYQHVVVYHVEKALLANIELRMNLGPSATPLGPAVRRDLPLLSTILDKAIASVSQAEVSKLAERWLPAGSTTLRLPAADAQLNLAERAWVQAHGRIRVGYDAGFAPITQRGPLGEFRGLGADVLKLAARKAGLDVEQELGASFAEVYAKGVAGGLDVVVGMSRAPQRRADYDFVGPFISVPTAFVTRDDDGALITETQDIGLRKVALLREHFLIPELRARHPGIRLVELDRQDQVLSAVAEGAADVALGNFQVINELIQTRFAGRVRITGTVRACARRAHARGRRVRWPRSTRPRAAASSPTCRTSCAAAWGRGLGRGDAAQLARRGAARSAAHRHRRFGQRPAPRARRDTRLRAILAVGADAAAAADRVAALVARSDRARAARGAAQGARARCALARADAERRDRRREAAAGAAKPGRQCRQVHRARHGRRDRNVAGARRRPGRAGARGSRHRAGLGRGRSRESVPALRSGRARSRATRRRRAGPGDFAADRAGHGWAHRGREPGWCRRLLSRGRSGRVTEAF